MASSYSNEYHVGDDVCAKRGRKHEILRVVGMADIGLYCVYPQYDAIGKRRLAAFLVPFEDVVQNR
jgi:hypothetical protein